MPDTHNSYDEVPYASVSLVETHPDRAATVATLFGLTPPDVARSRVLELGCAGGGNLVPMARMIPEGTFVGVDLSSRQIEQAKALAAQVGVTNITFHAMSLTEVGRDLGEFDYIICHGVYSWVPPEVQAAILRISSENLAPDGVAYVSYNTYPGWHVPGMIREMMLFHVRKIEEPAARVKAARAIIDFLAEHAPEKEGHHIRVLRDEAAQLRPHADSYVLHEHLEAINEPIYYHEFASRAASSGLKVVGDARHWTSASATPPGLSTVLDKVAHDPTDREQYFDFLTNRRFRRSLLCHADRPSLASPSVLELGKLRLSALVWPAGNSVDLGPRAPADFRLPDGTVRISTQEPMLKAGLAILAETYPRSVPFEELWSMVKSRLSRSGIDPGAGSGPLAERMLQAYSANAVELHAFEPQIELTISARPKAFEPARLAAATTRNLPNLRHKQVTVSEFDRLVVRQLDGESDSDQIVQKLIAAVGRDEFTIVQNGANLKDPTVIGPLLRKSLEPSLQRLLRAALMVG